MCNSRRAWQRTAPRRLQRRVRRPLGLVDTSRLIEHEAPSRNEVVKCRVFVTKLLSLRTVVCDIEPGTVDQARAFFGVRRQRVAHVPVLAFIDVEILARSAPERFDDTPLLNTANRMLEVLDATTPFVDRIFVRVRFNIRLGKLPWRVADKTAEPLCIMGDRTRVQSSVGDTEGGREVVQNMCNRT